MRIHAILLGIALLSNPCFSASPGESSSPATVEGILLGLSTGPADPENHISTQKFFTGWIVRHGKTAELVAMLPDLIVPRATGFWRVGIEHVCEMYGEHNEFRSGRDIVWSVPIDTTPRLSKGPECPSKQQNQIQSGVTSGDQPNDEPGVDQYTDCMFSNRSITFVSPNYISENATEGNTEACEARGGRSSDWSRVLSITTPEMEQDAYGEKGPVAKTLTDFAEQNPRQAANAFDTAYAEEVKGLNGEGFDCVGDHEDYLGWEIKRKNGTWTPWIFQQMYPGHSSCEISVVVPVQLPENLVGRNQLVPSLSELKKTVPELTDAFTAPRGDTIIVLTNAKILVFDVFKTKLGAKLLEVDSPKGAVAVMDQWAVGTHVDAWTQQVRKWKAHPPPEPIVTTKPDKQK